MKKKKLIPVIVVIVSLITIASAVKIAAASYVNYQGYKCRLLSTTTAALSGWDDRSPELVIPQEVLSRKITTIDDYAFFYDSVITSVDFSGAENLVSIGTGVFQGCSSITTATIPSWVSYLSDSLFQDCTSLETVVLAGDISKINAQMFYGCTSLAQFDVPSTVTSIEGYAFADCASLGSVTVPASVTSIDVTAFQNCPNLVLGVYYGSFAHTYAQTYNIAYTLLDGVKLGDADGDDNVNINDVTAIQRYIAELDLLEGVYLYASDVNRDARVDIDDATELQCYLSEYEVTYPINQVMTQ